MSTIQSTHQYHCHTLHIETQSTVQHTQSTCNFRLFKNSACLVSWPPNPVLAAKATELAPFSSLDLVNVSSSGLM